MNAVAETVAAEPVLGVEIFVPLAKLKKSPRNARKPCKTRVSRRSVEMMRLLAQARLIPAAVSWTSAHAHFWNRLNVRQLRRLAMTTSAGHSIAARLAPVSDIDPFSDATLADPYPVYRELRELGGAVRLDRPRPAGGLRAEQRLVPARW
ncbi:MAG TPA: hypothetical protein VNT42_13340 [Sphingomonas sp.]|nr:hypothetical protein [Sphingomonas sp.]